MLHRSAVDGYNAIAFGLVILTDFKIEKRESRIRSKIEEYRLVTNVDFFALKTPNVALYIQNKPVLELMRYFMPGMVIYKVHENSTMNE